MRIETLILALVLAGCAVQPQKPTEVTPVNTSPVALPVPNNPDNPGLKINTITVERIQKGEIPDVAYIGFMYDDWLEFAKWMHEYRKVNNELREVIKAYEERNNPTEPTNP